MLKSALFVFNGRNGSEAYPDEPRYEVKVGGMANQSRALNFARDYVAEEFGIDELYQVVLFSDAMASMSPWSPLPTSWKLHVVLLADSKGGDTDSVDSYKIEALSSHGTFAKVSLPQEAGLVKSIFVSLCKTHCKSPFFVHSISNFNSADAPFEATLCCGQLLSSVRLVPSPAQVAFIERASRVGMPLRLNHYDFPPELSIVGFLHRRDLAGLPSVSKHWLTPSPRDKASLLPAIAESLDGESNAALVVLGNPAWLATLVPFTYTAHASKTQGDSISPTSTGQRGRPRSALGRLLLTSFKDYCSPFFLLTTVSRGWAI